MLVLTFFAGIAGLIALHLWWRKTFEAAQAAAQAQLNDVLTQQQQALAQVFAEKMALFDNMVEGVLVLDAKNRVRLANRTLGRLFSLSREIIGQSILEALRIAELDQLVHRAAMEKQVLGFEVVLPGLEQRIFEVNVSGIFNDKGIQTGTILVFHDLTRIKRLENTRQEFVANVSHELRTPLTLIKGYTETLIDGALNQREVAERFLRGIERNADRLMFLIEDLLIISRLESGKIEIRLAPLNLKTAVDSAFDDFQAKARAKGVKLKNQVAPELTVKADSQRLNQVFSNLIDNAIKYGKTEGAVAVAARENEDGKMEISVQDDGPGIPSDSLGRIFERFYRVDKARSREQGGTGLGLSIVKHIVQNHGGKAWVSSKLGAGATFYFTLEAARSAADSETKDPKLTSQIVTESSPT